MLQVEQQKSENLLLNILPPEIARVLKNENRIIADHIEQASILFADVVNFTPMSASMSPTELVSLLDEIFSQFDTLVDKYNLEKIKTIGDCYMVASGVPRPRPDHAQALACLALDMQEYVSQNEIQGHQLQFRIGINSGPVVAGVIGRRKFSYDLWGDAVNTASRMESHGAGGTIQITRSTYELIQHEFLCERAWPGQRQRQRRDGCVACPPNPPAGSSTPTVIIHIWRSSHVRNCDTRIIEGLPRSV